MIPDPVSEQKLKKVLPNLATRWLNVRESMWKEHQKQLRITEGVRSYTNQWALWGLGRLKDKNGKWIICDEKLVVTHAKPGESFHQFGLALDSCFMGDDPYLAKLPKKESDFLWAEFGRFCKQEGLTWGGDWKDLKNDRPHCELTLGLSIHTVQMIYENNGLGGIFLKCNQILSCGVEMS